MASLFDEFIGADWLLKQDDPAIWNGVAAIPDERLWSTHLNLKRKLAITIRERMRNRWSEHEISLEQIIALGALFDPEALTIAFSRRFAEYKRPALLMRDSERLRKLLLNEMYPVNILYAGKSHPADNGSKQLLQQVYRVASDPAFKGRVIFLEDYDMHLARFLVQGVDVWLNNPRRLNEASGTSGMKAAVNGVLNVSVPDGWWLEGYNGRNGWAIGDGTPFGNREEEDRRDAEALFGLLEKEIVPLYYDQDRYGVPLGWTAMMKDSIRSIAPVFSTRRMFKQYIAQMYDPIRNNHR
jgi:starch phosphorylase